MKLYSGMLALTLAACATARGTTAASFEIHQARRDAAAVHVGPLRLLPGSSAADLRPLTTTSPGAASPQVIASRSMWLSCMQARGYMADPNGPLSAPAGSQLPFLEQ